MSASLVTVAYIAAIILFILSLGGLSNPETSRRGNTYGVIGMTIAVLATIFGPRVTAGGIPWIIGSLVVGGGVGMYLARTVQMTQMPELVAFMHSMVGLAACVVGFASYIDPGSMFDLATGQSLTSAEKTIHHIEVYVGILIGAVTLSGSVIAFGKLSGKIGGKPLMLPARHWLNLAGLIAVIWFGKQFMGADDQTHRYVPGSNHGRIDSRFAHDLPIDTEIADRAADPGVRKQAIRRAGHRVIARKKREIERIVAALALAERLVLSSCGANHELRGFMKLFEQDVPHHAMAVADHEFRSRFNTQSSHDGGIDIARHQLARGTVSLSLGH